MRAQTFCYAARKWIHLQISCCALRKLILLLVAMLPAHSCHIAHNIYFLGSFTCGYIAIHMYVSLLIHAHVLVFLTLTHGTAIQDI